MCFLKKDAKTFEALEALETLRRNEERPYCRIVDAKDSRTTVVATSQLGYY